MPDSIPSLTHRSTFIGGRTIPGVTAFVRKLFALLSACGLAVSVVAYIETFSEPHADTIFRLWIVLVPGFMTLFAPIYILEYPASRERPFLWKTVGWKSIFQGMPKWVTPCAWFLSLAAAAHVAWFALGARWGVPAIMDGQYVVEAHGHILRAVTEAEYVQLSAAGARGFASGMIACYFVPVMYWWFRRNQASAGPIPTAN